VWVLCLPHVCWTRWRDVCVGAVPAARLL